jgi:cyclophilin family peptidyl-prolyl cis-trans isomerase
MKHTRTLLALLALSGSVALPAFAQTPSGGTCEAALKGSGPVKVKLTTSMGPIVLELDKQKAPISTDNFVKYVDSGHYNGTVFHRVIDTFMIQGGGFTRDYVQKPTRAPIKNESTNGLANDAYTIAMARTNVRDSATSQFFINSGNNTMLNYAGEGNPGYAVFGKVVEGRDVVDKIRKVAVKRTSVSEGQPDVPVVIETAECVAAN